MAWAERQYTDLSRPVREFRFIVDRTEEGQRMDALLRSHYPWHSRTFYRGKLKRGEVLVGGRPAKPATRPRFGDEVVVQLAVGDDVPEVESADDLVVLYEDEHIVAVDKPSGMACHPVGRTRHGTLVNKLHARYRSDDPDEDTVPRLGHRLDRDTSGVVVCVKHRQADASITDLFTSRRVQKTYLAIVEGCPEPGEGMIDAPIGEDPHADTRLHQGVVEGGLPSRSRYAVRSRYARHALVALEPLTGRTHQLRVHMAHIGHPIVADHLYGDVRPLCASHAAPGLAAHDDAFVLARLALHAHRLALPHPVTGEPLVIESPLPEDMAAAAALLARAAPGAA
ncbi:MAG: RluA family pseudouridine synthase [Planctomycetota bacterium]|nr:RluA family pseudouridine synthase [Planctomycetota bacterium]